MVVWKPSVSVLPFEEADTSSCAEHLELMLGLPVAVEGTRVTGLLLAAGDDPTGVYKHQRYASTAHACEFTLAQTRVCVGAWVHLHMHRWCMLHVHSHAHAQYMYVRAYARTRMPAGVHFTSVHGCACIITCMHVSIHACVHVRMC